MKKPSLVPTLLAVLLGSLAASMPGCKSSGSSAADDAGGANAANSSGGDGTAGKADSAGGKASSGPSGAGAPGDAGSGALGDAGASNGGPAAGALPTTTFLYVKSLTPDTDELVSLDYATGDSYIITDQRGDGSDGWEIWGHAISPDRTRIVIASLYGPTKADNATGLATRRVWTMAADGSDFQRLTPVFDNDGGGRKNYSIDVQDPVFSQDGKGIIYDFGSWWYEGTDLQGGSFPWFVSARGDALPEPFPSVQSCSVIDPSVNPATGDVLFVHSVCINAADEGIFLYPSTGGSEPVKLVDRGYGAGAIDPSLEKASWLGDGSGFIFVGTVERDGGTLSAIWLYDMAKGETTELMTSDVATQIRNAAIAPNGDGIVYCLAHDDVLDLHAIDFTVAPPTDTAITDDGISCSPSF